jgi:ring-1,2-phenylacetyl-CoA epoxidase subunit PaaD
LRAAVEALPDPDLPVLTLGDLGMVGAVAAGPDGRAEVEITPTFAGCPAVDAIERAVRAVLAAGGHPQGRVRRTLVPAWTTERVSEAGRRKLAEHGIALRGGAGGTPCPRCGSERTLPLSPFGPTRCQALLRCPACQETFARLRGCDEAS